MVIRSTGCNQRRFSQRVFPREIMTEYTLFGKQGVSDDLPTTSMTRSAEVDEHDWFISWLLLAHHVDEGEVCVTQRGPLSWISGLRAISSSGSVRSRGTIRGKTAVVSVILDHRHQPQRRVGAMTAISAEGIERHR